MRISVINGFFFLSFCMFHYDLADSDNDATFFLKFVFVFFYLFIYLFIFFCYARC